MPPKRKRDDHDESDDEDTSFGRQILPVANLPADFQGEPEDGMQYLFTVRRDARHLPHVTRVTNPYEIAERPPHPPSDILPSVHPALPSSEWRPLFEMRCRNFRKNVVQPTIHIQQSARTDNRKLLPDLKERDLWWAFLSGRPASEWDIPKKLKQGQIARRFQRGMRAFADDDDSTTEVPYAETSRDGARDTPDKLPIKEDTEARPRLPTPSDTSAPTGPVAPEDIIYAPREPTPSLLKLIDQRMALHLLMYFTHWTNLHLQPEKVYRVTQTHARWIFFLLSRVDDYISADEMHLLRNLTRAFLALLGDLTRPKAEAARAVPDDINPASCWLIISAVVGIWGQRDLWMDAEDTIRHAK
ncbi:hypothetical protein B0H15DRAFT_946980 [Mycena belliarum]|uniref:Uncharacterized protein n=1 Tax=Mycena belliarum TaxID=1033014 RepID=A0AAD6U815_9AGAR|nr:hypothetical protein B0H15DRAFT_946980 [Mycena belliae]